MPERVDDICVMPGCSTVIDDYLHFVCDDCGQWVKKVVLVGVGLLMLGALGGLLIRWYGDQLVRNVTYADLLGWFCSIIILVGMHKQVAKQWKEGGSKNVSGWFYFWEIVGTLGFTIYSLMIGSLVYAVTNLILTGYCVAGVWLLVKHRRKEI